MRRRSRPAHVGIDEARAELQPHIDSRWVELLGGAPRRRQGLLAGTRSFAARQREPRSASRRSRSRTSCTGSARTCSRCCAARALSAATHGETLQQEQLASDSALCAISGRRPDRQGRPRARRRWRREGGVGDGAAMARSPPPPPPPPPARPPQRPRCCGCMPGGGCTAAHVLAALQGSCSARRRRRRGGERGGDR